MTCPIENQDERILRILNGQATPEEIQDFSEWLEIPENQAYFLQLKKIWNLTSGPVVSTDRVEMEWIRFRNYIRASENSRLGGGGGYSLRPILPWVAILFFPIVLGVYLFFKTDPVPVTNEVQQVVNINPGQSKAILTTADGREIVLGAQEQVNVEVGHNSFVLNNGSAIIYQEEADKPEKIQYNHLNVPRGGEYKIILSDGTEVYMNSASELRYPIAFGKEERLVYLSGEAYFKVKKEVDRPFIVCADAVRVRVYGTSFNVNTHLAGKIQTVLVEGSVGIRGNGQEYQIKPSQLAEFDGDGYLKQIRGVDVKPYIAWREGLFLFEDQSLEEIMSTLSLWYDIDVFYASSDVKNYHFTGYMQRYEQIDRILNAISKMVGVRFKMSGKTIVVSK